ncbi:hypothetical protein PAMP_024014 [Pampus punctatissimus]
MAEMVEKMASAGTEQHEHSYCVVMAFLPRVLYGCTKELSLPRRGSLVVS